MFAKLKEDTKECHSSVEKVLVSQLKNLSTVEEYGILLSKLYHFYEPVEDKVHQWIDESILPDIKKRVHVINLKSDLHNLGHELGDSNNTFSEKINSISYALGILYVMEGSTLGGQIISSMLTKKLPTIDSSITSYFNCYGENTTFMWSVFKENLENSKVLIDEKEMTQGAKDTFEHLQKWLLVN